MWRDFSNDGIPNCVPEYYRELFEREEHEAELCWEQQEHYNANKEKMKEAYEADLPILDYGGFDACLHCEDADHDTQTGFEDDFCRVICHNPDCPEHRKHKEDRQQ